MTTSDDVKTTADQAIRDAVAPVQAELVAAQQQLVDQNTAHQAAIAAMTAQLAQDTAQINALTTAQPTYTQVGAPGQVYSETRPYVVGVEYLGDVKLSPGVTLVNCLTRGQIIKTGPAVLINVIGRPTAPKVTDNSVAGPGDLLTVNCDFQGMVDGFHLGTGSWIDWYSKVGTLTWFPVDPSRASGGTHNDGASLDGNANTTVELHGTHIDVSGTAGWDSLSCIMMPGKVGPLKYFRADGCTFIGGIVPINVAGYTIPDFRITNCKIGPGKGNSAGQLKGAAIIMNAAQRAIWDANPAWHAGTTMLDGSPLVIARG